MSYLARKLRHRYDTVLSAGLRFCSEVLAWIAGPWAAAQISEWLILPVLIMLVGLPSVFSTENDKRQIIVSTPGPVRIGIDALLANLLLGASSAWYLSSTGFAGPHTGLAAATSFAAVLNAVLLYRGLHRAEVLQHGPGWGALLLRVTFANAVMIAALLWLARPVDWWIAAALPERVAWLALSVGAGGGAYFVALVVMGLRPAQFRMRHD